MPYKCDRCVKLKRLIEPHIIRRLNPCNPGPVLLYIHKSLYLSSSPPIDRCLSGCVYDFDIISYNPTAEMGDLELETGQIYEISGYNKRALRGYPIEHEGKLIPVEVKAFYIIPEIGNVIHINDCLIYFTSDCCGKCGEGLVTIVSKGYKRYPTFKFTQPGTFILFIIKKIVPITAKGKTCYSLIKESDKNTFETSSFIIQVSGETAKYTPIQQICHTKPALRRPFNEDF